MPLPASCLVLVFWRNALHSSPEGLAILAPEAGSAPDGGGGPSPAGCSNPTSHWGNAAWHLIGPSHDSGYARALASLYVYEE